MCTRLTCTALIAFGPAFQAPLPDFLKGNQVCGTSPRTPILPLPKGLQHHPTCFHLGADQAGKLCSFQPLDGSPAPWHAHLARRVPGGGGGSKPGAQRSHSSSMWAEGLGQQMHCPSRNAFLATRAGVILQEIPKTLGPRHPRTTGWR